ncbi:MAG: acetylornithine carbamoyltransferase [Candidatus Fluviicola riflensis]|nr:MAG: acetylornithine carbamoyltransferase [Candidatus Fluviicola riflensis]OGS78106.1 MAG: acetylornithine carbamoyltransferase [Candidatus Fluviicola riflensis]OGS85172.1 MAG: acetylornithine carbamoyltransferase [Fluviicola sp. RIFCSPHIGHO2_01_FULL_43_53]OGS89443.1 MAG: acetylornithine carbamoyltransferase [Fluviicola sp. RIFCSPHIGHO2_12_FULL_43_24]
MKQFTSVADVIDVPQLIESVRSMKGTQQLDFARGKNLAMLFFNPSLRTRMSTQTAAYNLGMTVSTLDAHQGWKLETEPGSIMNGDAQEQLQDAIRVMSGYTDLLAIRSFAGLQNKQDDYAETLLNECIRHSDKPVISLESAIRHPLQSLTDMVTIAELGIKKPKIAVTWAPHPKALPQAVVNSFLEWTPFLEADVWLAHPEGYELGQQFSKHAHITHNQQEALEGADIVYCKNWSSVTNYGQRLSGNDHWTVDSRKMQHTNNAHFMHCLPIRRNVVATDEVVDTSIVYQQAKNRIWAAQTVLQQLLLSCS